MSTTSTHARYQHGRNAAYRRIELQECGYVRRPRLTRPSFTSVPYRPISAAQAVLLDVVDVLDAVNAPSS